MIEEFWLVLGMTAVTFGVRYPSLALVGRMQLPDSVIRALRYVPVAVLTAIIVPYILFREAGFTFSFTNSYLIAGIIAALVSWRTKNLLLTIGVGLVCFFVYRILLGFIA
ncbi:MAG: AzlD domain-containing protein [Chloroflexota bacterium]